MKKREISMEERVLRGLRACGAGTWEECSRCPYQGLDQKFDACWEKLCADAVALLKRQARCAEILGDALDEGAVALGKLSDEVARLKRSAADPKATGIHKALRRSYFSAEEVRRMSLEEVAVHREVIIRSMKTWHGSERRSEQL